MVIQERTLLAGAAVAVGLMVAVVAWKQVSAPPRSAPAPRTTAAFSPEKIQTISTGERVDLAAHMPDAGRTVVEFTADW